MDSPALNATFPPFNNHLWYNCTKMPEGEIVWNSFSLLTVLLGLPLCIWVLWDLVETLNRGDQPCTPYTFFTLNATVMDLVFRAQLLLDVLNYYVWTNLAILFISYMTFCLNFCGRPLLMACVCLDCYMAVLHPHRYRSPSLSIRALITALIWLASLVYGGVFIMNPNLLAHPGMWWPFLASLVVIVYCDCRILCTLRSSAISGGEPHRQKKRALNIIFVSLLITLTHYLPSMFAISLGALLFPSEVYYCLVVIPATIPLHFTSVFMSILHLSKVGKLSGIKSKFCK